MRNYIFLFAFGISLVGFSIFAVPVIGNMLKSAGHRQSTPAIFSFAQYQANSQGANCVTNLNNGGSVLFQPPCLSITLASNSGVATPDAVRVDFEVKEQTATFSGSPTFTQANLIYTGVALTVNQIASSTATGKFGATYKWQAKITDQYGTTGWINSNLTYKDPRR